MLKTSISKPKKILLGILLGCSPFVASAAQLGSANIQSRLGETLDANVGVWLSPNEIAKGVSFTVTPDISYADNERLSEIASSISATLERGANGATWIKLTTPNSVAEPIVAFRLKMHVGDKALMRTYALMLNPAPRAATPQSPTQSFERSSRIGAPIDGDDYAVRAGDSLWAIAQRVSGSGKSASTLVEEIFLANPHAFVNGDQNRLKAGVTLQLPGASTIVSPVSASIEESVVQPSARVSEPPIPALVEPALSPNLEETATVSTVEETTSLVLEPVLSANSGANLAAQIDELRANYLALLAERSAELEQSTSTAQSEVGAPASGTELIETIVDGADPQLAAGAAVAQLNASDATPVDAPVERSILEVIQSSTVFLITVGVAVAALLALLGLALFNRTGKALATRHAVKSLHAKEEEAKAQIAAKAASRIEMEGEVKRMLEERDKTPKQRDEGDETNDAIELPSVTEMEINASIAHGHYAEAEGLLQAVINQSARNYSAKLRLAEVYYMSDRVGEFCHVAEDLHQSHRDDISDEEWRRVLRMGKIIAPNRVPFSGPQAVEDIAPAAS